MLNPFKLIAVYGDLNKMQSIWNEKGDVMQKLTQYLALVVSLAGTLGVPALAQHWLAAPSHKVVYTCLVAAAILLHAIFPSVFADASDAVKKSTGLGVILLMLAFAGTASAQTVTPTTTPTSPFTLSTSAVSVQINGQSSVASDVVASLPFIQTKNYGLFTLTEHNLMAPAINLTGYYGGLMWTPNTAKLIAKTLIPANTFQPYLQFGSGVVTGSARAHSSTFLGGCMNYDPTEQGHFGIPICVSYLNAPGFGKSPNGWLLSAGLKWSF